MNYFSTIAILITLTSLFDVGELIVGGQIDTNAPILSLYKDQQRLSEVVNIDKSYVIAPAKFFPSDEVILPILNTYSIKYWSYNKRSPSYYFIESVIRYPNATTDENNYDIVVLKIYGEFTDPQLAPVCLPISNVRDLKNPVITGWGDMPSGSRSPNELQEVTVPTLTNTQCRLLYGTSVTTNMICAGPLSPQLSQNSTFCERFSDGIVTTNNGTLVGFSNQLLGCNQNSTDLYLLISNIYYYLDFLRPFVTESPRCGRRNPIV